MKMFATTPSPRSGTRIAVTLLAAFMLALSGVGLAATAAPVTPAAAAGPTLPAPDGLTEASAAASCWEIRQNTPSAPSGLYWLATPALGGPEQFYCDQTRNGGGWVLVGRGREDWSVAASGNASPEQVRSVVTGVEAFAPKQLSIETIGALNNDQPISTMVDGIRLVRATDIAGTTWQDFSFTLSSPRKMWTWQFTGQQRVAAYRIDGRSYAGGSSVYTQDFGRDNSLQRVRTITGATEGWKRGFGFGANVRGNPSATSYLWSKDTSTGYARPFTQVYIRPKLLSSDVYTAIPDAGTPERTVAPGASSFALPQKWGVAGIGAGPTTIEGSNEVSAFAESGNVVYVGGNFLRVQKTAGGAGAVAQSYLAAFDRDTGEWLSTFRPKLDNQVKAIVALQGGRIAVGGFFTQVNGQSRSMLAVLEADGSLAPGWNNSGVVNNLAGGGTSIRTLDVQDGWLYAGGKFTHAMGGANTQQWYARNAARFSLATGAPDRTWNPELDAAVMSLDASGRGDRVYVAGFFAQSRGRTALKAAALATDSTDLLAWTPTFSSTTNYQQTVLEAGDRVWLGGAEHSLFSYARDDFALLSTSIGNAGGDFQALATDGTLVYGGCHCFFNQYEGAKTWPSLGTNWTAVDAIYGTGAWGAASGARAPEFNGEATTTTRGAGSWALMVDSTGTLWQGGDYTSSTKAGYVKQWSGGFMRNAQRDAVAPSTPTDVAGRVAAGGAVELSWRAATDQVGVVGYEVLRKDRVIATVADTRAVLPAAPSGLKYFIRAIDAEGNRSASTPAIDPSALPPGNEVETVIAEGANWRYLYDGNGPADGWTSVGFDDASWSSGTAPIGWGHTGLGTTLTTTVSPKPLTSFYRKTFQVADMTRVVALDLVTRVDDGIVVSVNGTEVGRVNVDPGPDGVGVFANLAVSAASARANPVTIEVPGDLLVTGTNVITASVHSNYRSTPSHSFELSARATISPTPVRTEPTPPDPEPVVHTESLVAPGSPWSYLYDAAGPAGDWASASYDDSAWLTGAAPIGWGQAALGTTLKTDLATKPLTSFYRKRFEIADPSAVERVSLTIRADDGIVLYVNGTELTRVNMPDGPDGVGVFATTAIGATAALSNPVTIEIPLSALQAGTNVIAASVHSNYRTTPSHSFELAAIATLSE